jgi:hypothetical protein
MSVNASTREAPGPEINMTLVWSVVAFVVIVVGGFATPWDTIQTLLENRGPTDEQAQIVAFVAGYTLPLTAATFGLVFAWLAGWFEDVEWPWHLVIIGVVLFIAGALARELGLGLLPDYAGVTPHGPPYVAIPLFALEGYFNAYGSPLMLSAGAIGAGAALQARKWMQA